MNKSILAYAAGIIDGEGCIGVYQHKLNPKRGEIHPRHILNVKVAMTDKKVILWLYKHFGGSWRKQKYRSMKFGTKEFKRWKNVYIAKG